MRWQDLSEDELYKLPIKRLLNVLKIARATASAATFCDCGCGEPYSAIYCDDDSRVIRAEQYWKKYEEVKSICNEREHHER